MLRDTKAENMLRLLKGQCVCIDGYVVGYHREAGLKQFSKMQWWKEAQCAPLGVLDEGSWASVKTCSSSHFSSIPKV